MSAPVERNIPSATRRGVKKTYSMNSEDTESSALMRRIVSASTSATDNWRMRGESWVRDLRWNRDVAAAIDGFTDGGAVAGWARGYYASWRGSTLVADIVTSRS